MIKGGYEFAKEFTKKIQREIIASQTTQSALQRDLIPTSDPKAPEGVQEPP